MPRGRKPVGRPSAVAPPIGPDDPHVLIDAALQGWARDAQVRAFWPGKPSRGSWIDATNHPHDPSRRGKRGRPANHYLPLVAKAVQQLRADRGWKKDRACGYVADRLLSVLPADVSERVLSIPPSAVESLAGDARHAAARKWLTARLKHALP